MSEPVVSVGYLGHDGDLGGVCDGTPTELEQVKAERDRLRQWYLAVDAEAVMMGLVVEPTDDAKAALGRVLDWHVKVALDPLVSADARALRDTYLEERDRLAAEVARYQEALTPSGGTKAAYIGEFKFTSEDVHGDVYTHVVPWTTTKDIMAAIRARAEAK